MRKLFVSSAAALILTACATRGPAAYGPAVSGSDTGFETTQIETDRFRVGYTARSNTEAKDFALLRAAHVAKNEGYSHFEVIRGDVYSNGRSSPVSTSIGFGTSSFGRRSRSGIGIGLSLNDVGRMLEGDKVTHMLEVRLRNDGGTDPNIYDAESVINNIRPEVFR